ncbi:N-alpha-acetyltransferase 25, NatB auxiliary subunit isoform X1 [Sphaerodactylus townsendi]|nr:N-alpha-acetyltransferase 25, NatB auxiliary subunit isoform X1 [Sphaerodactylus townsendi]XP_048370359.1 N-alpha-acetyltransferase 25, NatB auxiliary subunit isoform X1 [Sphaerodactylus townsendi]
MWLDMDYLDNGNNKMAIQQADKLLKKHKDLHCAKVLKAIGLQRTGKQDEAFALAQEVAALEPTDDNSLQALTILYREMHRPELVTKLYEAAVKKVPNSEEYHSHLFMAYARVGEYKKMQQAGMALYKIVPKNPYYFWSVMSLIMQSISAQDENLSKTMFLPLAERMVEKMVKEDKIEAEAEVKLYYMILERLEKYQEALDVVRGKLGEKLTSELQSREIKCMEMYRKLGKWPECSALSRKLLLKNPDDWQFYIIYFDSVFQLIDAAWTPPAEGEHSLEGEVHHSIEQAMTFVEQRISKECNSTRPLRGPYLARLELIRRLRHRGCSEEHKLGNPEELLFEYFKRFGEKPCCFTDLKVFVDLLPSTQYTKFINQLLGVIPLSAPSEGKLALPESIKALQQHLCVVQLTRLLGLYHTMDKAQKLGAVRDLMLRYQHGLELGKSCLKTELQFSDYYCLLAVHLLLDIWLEAGEEPAAWQCLTLLEEGLTHSPSNAQFKLLLIRIYCMLGAFEPVVELYSSLDAKHIQHDTIGYLLTRYAAALGNYIAASQSCNFALRFFHSNQKDTSEYIIQAYKYGAFEKIPEFIAFRNRLNSSLHFAQVRIERMLLDLLLEANISVSLEESIKSMSLSPEEDDIPWKDLRDNRDLTVLFSWDPKDRSISEEHRKLSLEEETIWLQIRSLTLRLISGLPALGHSAPHPKNSEKTTENGVSSKIDTVRDLLQQLDAAVKSGKQFLEQKIQYPVLGPPPSRMASFFSSGSCQCQTSLFHLVSEIYELDTNGLEDSTVIQERIGNSFKLLLQQLTDLFSTCKGDLLEVREGSFMVHPNILENLVFFLETISIVLWVCSYSDAVLRPCRSNLQKKKKKKKESAALPPVFSSFQDYVSGLQTLTSNVIDYIKGLEVTLTALKLEELSIEDTFLSPEEKKFTKTALVKVQNSYQHSIQEIGELLKKRLDSIRNLKV